MKQLIALAVALTVLIAPAYSWGNKDKKEEVEVKVERNYKDYQEVRAIAKVEAAAGNHALAAEKFLAAAALTPDKWVEAWQLNNAADSILKAAELDKNGNPTKEAAQRALEILDRAEAIARANPAPEGKPDASVTISKNKLFCECVLEKRPW